MWSGGNGLIASVRVWGVPSCCRGEETTRGECPGRREPAGNKPVEVMLAYSPSHSLVFRRDWVSLSYVLVGSLRPAELMVMSDTRY